jgi:GntR family transcriptional regulator, transcriptional repressor for pyruvate dehydrogenase complex
MARTGRRGAPRILSGSEQVAEGIERFIAENGLKPGDRLGREEDLAEQFGVSRPTLREALRLLGSGGRVRATKGPGGGVFVNRTSEEGLRENVSDSIELMLETETVTLEDLAETRRLIEIPLAGEAAAHATPEVIAEMQDAIDGFELTGDVAYDAQFHRLIASASGNRVTEALADWIFAVLQPRLVATIAPTIQDQQIVAQHRAILRAIETGDRGAAEEAARQHHAYLEELLADSRPVPRRSD